MFAIARGGTKFVECGGVSIADDAAVAKLRGRLVDKGGLKSSDHIGKFLDVLDEMAVKVGLV